MKSIPNFLLSFSQANVNGCLVVITTVVYKLITVDTLKTSLFFTIMSTDELNYTKAFSSCISFYSWSDSIHHGQI